MNNMQQQGPSSFTAYILAKVAFIDDPLKKQRIKVTIPNKMDGDISSRPWLLKASPISKGSGSNYGSLSVPYVGAWVRVRFEEGLEDGDLNYGYYDSETPVAETVLAQLEINYPNRSGWQDKSGNYFVVDETPGATLIEVFHKSGTKISIDDQGSLTATVVKNLGAAVAGNATLNAQGTLDLRSAGAMTIHSDTSINMTAPRVDINS